MTLPSSEPSSLVAADALASDRLDPGTPVVRYATFDSAKDAYPRLCERRWDELVQLLLVHRQAAQKDGAAWSPTDYPPNARRSNAAVEAVTVAVFDFDHCVPEWSLLDKYEYVAYTTHSHSADDPHWRVVLALAVPVPTHDWAEARQRMELWLAPTADKATKDLARLYYWPSCPPGAEPKAFHHPGEVLDWRDLKPVPQADADEDIIGVAANGGGERPGDRYAAETDWSEILEPHGWELVRTSGTVSFWRCPASDKPRGGHCATTGHNGKDYLYVFCGAEGTPFEGQKAYSKFGAYAALEHDGDYRAAAGALAERYGMAWDSPSSAGTGSGTAKGFMRTDLGNAERLVARFGHRIRYCHVWKKWLVYDGRRWRVDAEGAVFRMAEYTVRQIYAEASAAATLEERQKIAKWGATSESEQRLKAMVNLAKHAVGVEIEPDELDADPWLLNVANGTLDLKTGLLREHRADDLITKMVPVEYDPSASCPSWLAFLDRIMGGNQSLIDFLQRAVGYALSGSTREQVLFLMHGTGANGKSTFLDAIQSILADFAQQADFSTFIVKDRESIRNDIARLRGARLVSAVEAEAGRRLSEVVVKQLTGGDRVTARFLYGEHFEFTPTFKLFLAVNHRPRIINQDNGIWRRIRLIPFDVTIPPEERDRRLPDKLHAELPGILAWAVQGCLAWQRDGLCEPPAVLAATSAYKAEMDSLGDFLDAHCERDPSAQVESSLLYRQYVAWAESNGEKVVTNTTFGLRLAERGFTQCRIGKARTRGWSGLRVVSARAVADTGQPVDDESE